MAVFRRARGRCPTCGRDIRVNTSSVKAKSLKAECCGADVELPLSRDWWVSYREGGRTRTRKVGPDRQLACKVEAKIQTSLAEGRYLDKKATCSTTLADAVRIFVEETSGRRKSYLARNLASMLGKIADRIGPDVMLDKLDESHIEGYRARRLGKGLKPGSVATELAWLRAALRWAQRRGFVEHVPEIKIPNPHNERVAMLTKDEARKLLACCAEVAGLTDVVGAALLADVVGAALFTGCRRGELLALRWEWIDLQAGRITIPAGVTKNKNPKVIPISDDMRGLLRRRLSQACPGAPVFHREGKPVPWHAIERFWFQARARAGYPGLHFHDLRHVAASLMVGAGIDLYTVSKILGHTSMKMSARYAHLADENLRRAVNCLNLGIETKTPPPAELNEAQDCQAVANVIPLQLKQEVSR